MKKHILCYINCNKIYVKNVCDLKKKYLALVGLLEKRKGGIL